MPIILIQATVGCDRCAKAFKVALDPAHEATPHVTCPYDMVVEEMHAQVFGGIPFENGSRFLCPECHMDYLGSAFETVESWKRHLQRAES